MVAVPASLDMIAPAPAGAPSKFTPAVRAALLQAFERGYTRKIACTEAGISTRTFEDWAAQAKADPESDHAVFFRQVDHAKERAKRRLVDEWLAVGAQDWRSRAKYLAILDPEEFSEQRQIQVQHAGQVTHTHVHVLAPPDLNQVFQLLGAPDAIDGASTEAL